MATNVASDVENKYSFLMGSRNETATDMGVWEFKIPMQRPNSNVQALMETPPAGHTDDSLQQSDPIRMAIRRQLEAMSEEDQFHAEALFFEGLTIRAFAERIGVRKSQAHRIKNRLAKRIADTLLQEPLIQERTNDMQPSITQPTTWEAAATEALIVIEQNAAYSPLHVPLNISIGKAARYVNEGHTKVSIIEVDEAILDVAITAWLWLAEDARNGMFPLLCQRQRKYGPKNITKFGETGIIVRMSDKVERINHMGGDFADDSVVDAYMDLVGYAAIYFMLVNDIFELPLENG